MKRHLNGSYETRNTSLEASQWDALHAIAKATGCTLQSLYREAVDAVLAKHQGGQQCQTSRR